MPDDGCVLFARREGAWVLRFEGAIRYTMAPAVDAFLDELNARRDVESVCVDLNPTTAIDSTGIGLIAKIAIGARRAGRPKPVLFCAQADINEVLCSVCIDEVCEMVADVTDAGAVEPIASREPGPEELERTIFAAHRLLADLSERNRAAFQGVLDAFARDAANRAAGPTLSN